MSDVLLRDILGAKFDAMPPLVKEMHSLDRTKNVRGTAKVVGGKNPLSRLVHFMARLPKPRGSTSYQ
ncbi:MAG: hypothetical protein GC131_03965 [Alphaproteobacteria bacterium]|nr:hypothetical protein [Alphaproteobacteria bacterium]